MVSDSHVNIRTDFGILDIVIYPGYTAILGSAN